MFHFKASNLMRLSSSVGKVLRPNRIVTTTANVRNFSLYPVDDVLFGLTDDQQQVGGGYCHIFTFSFA